MILAFAVVIGLAAGVGRAWLGKRNYRAAELRLPSLVLLAFLPQFLFFTIARMGLRVPGAWAPWILVSSQILLLVFAWLNRRQPGFYLLGAGLLLNFLVIVLNGGLMPISPEMVRRIYPGVAESKWQVGSRLGNGKDIVLVVSETKLWFLSDRFSFPGFLPFQVAFSAGDVLIALGAFWLLWSLGGSEYERNYSSHHPN